MLSGTDDGMMVQADGIMPPAFMSFYTGIVFPSQSYILFVTFTFNDTCKHSMQIKLSSILVAFCFLCGTCHLYLPFSQSHIGLFVFSSHWSAHLEPTIYNEAYLLKAVNCFLKKASS